MSVSSSLRVLASPAFSRPTLLPFHYSVLLIVSTMALLEGIHAVGTKLRSPDILDDIHRLFMAHPPAIGAIADQGVVRVGNGRHPGPEHDLAPLSPLGVAVSIKPLVVVEDNRQQAA